MIRRLVERRQEYCDGCGSCRRERHSIVTINVFTVIFLFFVLPATSMAADARSPSLFVQHHRRLSSDATDNNNAATTTLSSSANTNDDSGNDEDEECMEAEKCQMCTFSDQKSIPACQQTGRMQKFTCHSTRDDGTTSQEEVRYEIRSCQHTEADEEFGMVRLQMFCLLIGSLAFASVRKQKRLSASLFDQRKQGINGTAATPQQPPRGRRDSNLVTPDSRESEEEIEFTPMTNQETIPLVRVDSNSRLEII